MIQVNFIPREHRARQQARRRRGAWLRFLRAYAIILAVASALMFLPAHAAPPSLESSIARLDRSIARSAAELDGLKNRGASIAKQLDTARSVGDHPDWSALLAAVARACSDESEESGGASAVAGTMLESFDFSISKVEDKAGAAAASAKAAASGAATPAKAPPMRETAIIKLSGIAASPAACFRFAHALETLDIFDRVTVKETRSQSLGHMPATRFEIEAVILGQSTQPPVPAAPGATK